MLLLSTRPIEQRIHTNLNALHKELAPKTPTPFKPVTSPPHRLKKKHKLPKPIAFLLKNLTRAKTISTYKVPQAQADLKHILGEKFIQKFTDEELTTYSTKLTQALKKEGLIKSNGHAKTKIPKAEFERKLKILTDRFIREIVEEKYHQPNPQIKEQTINFASKELARKISLLSLGIGLSENFNNIPTHPTTPPENSSNEPTTVKRKVAQDLLKEAEDRIKKVRNIPDAHPAEANTSKKLTPDQRQERYNATQHMKRQAEIGKNPDLEKDIENRIPDYVAHNYLKDANLLTKKGIPKNTTAKKFNTKLYKHFKESKDAPKTLAGKMALQYGFYNLFAFEDLTEEEREALITKLEELNIINKQGKIQTPLTKEITKAILNTSTTNKEKLKTALKKALSPAPFS